MDTLVETVFSFLGETLAYSAMAFLVVFVYRRKRARLVEGGAEKVWLLGWSSASILLLLFRVGVSFSGLEISDQVDASIAIVVFLVPMLLFHKGFELKGARISSPIN